MQMEMEAQQMEAQLGRQMSAEEKDEAVGRALDSQLERTESEIARLQAELRAEKAGAGVRTSGVGGMLRARRDAAEPEPEPAEPARDWSFIKSSSCSGKNLLGEGGGSEGVYRLVSPATGEPFAVKVVPRALVAGGDAKHHFEREVEILNSLRHPGICRLVHTTSDSVNHLLVIELCDGGDFFGVVSQGALAEDVALDYFAQIVSAVGYCHSKRVYHRDLKLENVLVHQGRLKIADFGMAKHCSPGSDPRTRQVGTVAYMSPEVIMAEGAGYDGSACDVWSMGVMLYVMVVCNYPFGFDGAGQSMRKLMARIGSGMFSFPSRPVRSHCHLRLPFSLHNHQPTPHPHFASDGIQ